MATANFNRLLDNARIKAPGALDAAIQIEIFDACLEFFDASGIWYEDIAFTVTPTTSTYNENPDAYTYQAVPSQGTPIRLAGVLDTGGFPISASMETPGFIVLTSSPEEETTYRARIILNVVDPVTREGNPEFPDWILTKYGSYLLDGVLGRLMGQLAKPYSSPMTAQYHLRRFRKGISQARAEARHANIYGAQRWSFPQSFAIVRGPR